MQICICDDEELEREVLLRIIEIYFEKRFTDCDIRKYSAGEELIDDFVEGYVNPDIIFMDILLPPGINGFDACKTLRREGFCGDSIFIASVSSYATRGYEVNARAYIMKPYNLNLIGETLDRIFNGNSVRKLAIKEHGRVHSIPISNIMYIESENQKCHIHCNKDTTYSLKIKLNELENMIDSRYFLRCHQSYLVNLNYVLHAENEFILQDRSRIQIRARDRKLMKEAFFNFLKNTDCRKNGSR
jgi:DNA-binding LytR/AlgR family response regulator